MAVQAINVPLHEEWVLRKSFGDEFTEYCTNVPRWIPRLHPYTPAKSACTCQLQVHVVANLALQSCDLLS